MPRDIEAEASAAAEVRAMGAGMIPVIAIDGQPPIIGFNPDKLRQALGIRQQARSVDPRQVLVAHDRVLEAIQRAVRQIPDSRLSMKTPDRDRTLREHVWHIFRFAELALLEGPETGRLYMPNPMGSFAKEAAAYATSESIARYGEGTRAGLRARFSSAPDEAFEQLLDTYAGPMRLLDIAPWVTNHSAHHLRQIYDLMQRVLGVAPSAPLQVEAMPEIAVLDKLW